MSYRKQSKISDSLQLEAQFLFTFIQQPIFYISFLINMDSGKLKLLGQGSNSEIYRYGCIDQGVVLKVVPASSSKESKHLANEYRILSTINHQNIIKVLKYQQKINLNGIVKNVLVLENAIHGSLLDFYKKASPAMNQIRWIFAEISEAVHYLHCNYFVHRDLKLENVLVCQNESQIQIKLSDFGFACTAKQNHLSNAYKGTKRGYMAPEIHQIAINNQSSEALYDMYKCDIFALGVILFTLVMGRLPFEYASKQNSHYKCISEARYDDFWRMHQPVVAKVENIQSSNFQDFKTIFQQMVHEDPTKRPTIKQVLECSWLLGKQEIIESIKKGSKTRTINN